MKFKEDIKEKSFFLKNTSCPNLKKKLRKSFSKKKLFKPIVDVVPVCEESIETGFHEISASLAAKPDQIYAADSQDEEELLKAVTDDES